MPAVVPPAVAIPSPEARDAAVKAACAAIARAFGPGAIHAHHRQMAKTALRALSGGISEAAFDAFARRYGDLALALPEEFSVALQTVETRLVHERALWRRHAAGAWFLRPSRTRLAILTETRLILRFLRRRGLAERFAPTLAAITAPTWARIAAQ